MATQKPTPADLEKAGAETLEKIHAIASGTDDTPAEKGRLVLATGRIVAVPADGVAVATEHLDEELGVTVPVTSRFVLP